MGKVRSNKNGSIYYDKKDCRSKCAYYITDNNSLVEVRKTKSFLTKQEAQNFLIPYNVKKETHYLIKIMEYH